MSLQNTEELIEKLDSQEIGISIPDSQKDPRVSHVIVIITKEKISEKEKK